MAQGCGKFGKRCEGGGGGEDGGRGWAGVEVVGEGGLEGEEREGMAQTNKQSYGNL